MKKILWMCLMLPIFGQAQDAEYQTVHGGNLVGPPLTPPYSEKWVIPPPPPPKPPDPPDTAPPPPPNPEERARLLQPYIEQTEKLMKQRKVEKRPLGGNLVGLPLTPPHSEKPGLNEILEATLPTFRFVKKVLAEVDVTPRGTRTFQDVAVLHHDKWELTCFATLSDKASPDTKTSLQTCIPDRFLPPDALEEVRRK